MKILKFFLPSCLAVILSAIVLFCMKKPDNASAEQPDPTIIETKTDWETIRVVGPSDQTDGWASENTNRLEDELRTIAVQLSRIADAMEQQAIDTAAIRDYQVQVLPQLLDPNRIIVNYKGERVN